MGRLFVSIAVLLLTTAASRHGGTSSDVAVPNGSERLRSTRVLAQKITASGRGEVRVTLTREDPMGGSQVVHGTAAFEPPDRVRLEFAETGERITVRADGGEWLQPRMHQMVRLAPEQASAASSLWELFLHGGRGRFDEREVAGGRYQLTFRGEDHAIPEHVTLTLDAGGLPRSLETRDETQGHSVYAFSGWKFSRAKGPSAFEIKAPRGYTVMEEAEGMMPELKK
jgi:outer membrane lipoprotein-sorting protein